MAVLAWCRKVDKAIERLNPTLENIAATGRSDLMRSDTLLKHIAENSRLYTDVIMKTGLLDMSQIAWKNDEYYEMWNLLRKDYEIDRRFDALNRKVCIRMIRPIYGTLCLCPS